ncbi:MAG: hypothetical protein GXP55_14695 [Deltaproteobacteria bacterium]|nr:hypothetical protein [Deltaproteobacteria bacterium]
MIPRVLVALALGALSWSLLEYVIHRWAGHDRRLRGNIFEREHTRHHSRGDYFAASWKKAGAAALLMALVIGPAILVAGPVGGITYAAGLAGFYLYYEILHRREHTHEGVGPYGRWARRHHFYHHFVDPSMNHGVTSPVWDLVFRTYRTPGVVPVPKKLSMRWLTDEKGQVREHLAAFYALRPGKGTATKSTPAGSASAALA